MNVACALLSDTRFPGVDIAARCLVVVAHEETRFVRQGKDLLYRLVELCCIAAGKVGARTAEVRHEQRVADKGGIANDIGNACWRVARRCDDASGNSADVKGLIICEQMIELAPVRSEILEIEYAFECFLHSRYVGADSRSATQLFPYVRRTTEVIRVHMCFEDPVDFQVFAFYKLDHLVC